MLECCHSQDRSSALCTAASHTSPLSIRVSPLSWIKPVSVCRALMMPLRPASSFWLEVSWMICTCLYVDSYQTSAHAKLWDFDTSSISDSCIHLLLHLSSGHLLLYCSSNASISRRWNSWDLNFAFQQNQRSDQCLGVQPVTVCIVEA